MLKVTGLISGPLREEPEMRYQIGGEFFKQSEEDKNNNLQESEKEAILRKEYDFSKILAIQEGLLKKRNDDFVSQDLESKNKNFFRKPCPAYLKLCYFYG